MSAEESFFCSRWSERPDHVQERDARILPAGFEAGGVGCGLKDKPEPDLGLVVCRAEEPVSAARFTKNAVLGAPVELNLAEASLDILRAVVVNSGNANVLTGEPGLAVARKVRDEAAQRLGLHPHHVAVASTGVIGSAPSVDKILAGLEQACSGLSQEGAAEFADAILTSDSGPKRTSVVTSVDGGEVGIALQVKGGGMISPAFSSATTLCFVETDARLSPGSLERGLDQILARTVERVTVDAQLSTSDSFFLIASGASGVDCSEAPKFFEALESLLMQAGLALVADGEGSETVTRIYVKGAHDFDEAERVGRAVADSSLVKTAAYGKDPNWGRVVQAAGAAIGLHSHHRETLRPSLWLEGKLMCERGRAKIEDESRSEMASLVSRAEVEMVLDLHRGEAESEVFFSDLSHRYIEINAEYS